MRHPAVSLSKKPLLNFDFVDVLLCLLFSARIAKQEDDEQLRLLEEEEKRERMRQAKKRKMSH